MTTTDTFLSEFIDRQLKALPAEANITRKVIRALKAADKPVTIVYDGEERVPVNGEREILEQVFNLDESYLITEDGSWVRLIMGNEWDVICDYTTNLEEILAPVSDYASERG